MKLIVSDASPLIVIAKSGLLPVLTALVEEVVIPETVYAECTVEISLPGARAVRAAVEAGQIASRRYESYRRLRNLVGQLEAARGPKRPR